MKTKEDFIDYVHQKAKSTLAGKRLALELWVSVVAIFLVALLLSFIFSISLVKTYFILFVFYLVIVLFLVVSGKTLTTISKKKIKKEATRLYPQEKKKLEMETEKASNEIDALYQKVVTNSNLLKEL